MRSRETESPAAPPTVSGERKAELPLGIFHWGFLEGGRKQ